MHNPAPLLLLALALLLPGADATAVDAVETARTLLRKEQEALARTTDAVTGQRELQQRRSGSIAGEVRACAGGAGADCARAAEAVTPMVAEQARLDAEAARVALEGADLDLQASQHLKQELEAAIAQLETALQEAKAARASGNPAPSDRPLAEMEAELAEKRELVRVEGERQATRQRVRELVAERFTLARSWSEMAAGLLRKAREASQQNALETLQARLEQEQQLWLGRAARWRSELPADADAAAARPGQALLQTRIDSAEEQARLAQDRIRLAQIRARLDAVEARRLDADSPSDELNRIHEQVVALRRELAATQSLLAKRRNVLAQRVEVAERRPAAAERGEQLRLLRELDADLNAQFTATGDLLAATAELPAGLEAAYNRSFRRGLAARFSLPADIPGWYALARELSALPAVFAGRVADSLREVVAGLERFTVDRWLLVVLVLGFWSAATARLRRLSTRRRRSGACDDGSFVRNLMQVPLALLERGGHTYTAVGGVAALLWLAAPPEPAHWLLGAILAAWAATRIAVDLQWALLADPDAPAARRHPALFGQVRWMTFALGALATVTALSHLVGLSAVATNAIDRLFMLFLLLFTVPALETRRFALALIAPRLGERYWMRVIRLLSLLAPLAVLAAASVGVAGYLNLAWGIGKALASVLAALALWLISARLLREGVEALRRRVHGHDGGGGALLVAGVIDPLHALARPLLFLLLWSLPLQLYGIGWDTPLIASLGRLARTPLASVGSTDIHAIGVLVVVLVAIAVVRVGRWMRLMTYRWAFARITDLGIRHSLSVFTQYSFVLLGVLFTLRLVGFDLTSVAIFAGAIGVGVGFGLQNIANNFISGVLLLVERPLRTADIVKIGEHEGEVTHIGMRSLTVKTWDNQEVIMPNSEVLSHAFTNWTHSDNIVRSVIPLGISYDSDPRVAKAAIEQVLAQHPALLAEPRPRVWLAGFGDSSVQFHVQYFVDVGRHSRPEVKSEVLFALWDALQAAGVRIPYPQLDVTLHPAPAAGSEPVTRALTPIGAAA